MRSSISVYSQWFVAIFAALIVTSSLWARSSPVGGGYLKLKDDAFAFVSDTDALQIEDEFTIEVWIYADALPQPGETWFIAGKLESYQLILQGSVGNINLSFLSFMVCEEGQINVWTITRSVDDDICARWMHIVGIYEDGTIRLAIDGDLSKPAEVSKKISQSDAPFSVGYAEGGKWQVSHFNGMIDELRISNKVRYRLDFKPPSHPFKVDRDTLALWHFDEIEGARSSKDASGNGYTLIVRNAFFHINSLKKLHTTWGELKE
jgi:hypothetical protein